jgi:hypothetical protein
MKQRLLNTKLKAGTQLKQASLGKDQTMTPNQLNNKLLLDDEDVSAEDIEDQVDDLADRLIQEEKDQKVLDDRS